MSSAKPAPKVFGIGLSKTGTTSLYAALQILCFKSGTYLHMRELGLHKWFKGDFTTDYLSDYDAVTDLPISAFYPQLYHRYPGSKFVLTIRDKDDWLRSCQRQLGGRPEDDFSRSSRLATYGCESFNEDRFIFVYETHLRNVQWFFRKHSNSLLILDLIGGQGWETLCPFLGLQVPDIEFPSVKPGYIV